MTHLLIVGFSMRKSGWIPFHFVPAQISAVWRSGNAAEVTICRRSVFPLVALTFYLKIENLGLPHLFHIESWYLSSAATHSSSIASIFACSEWFTSHSLAFSDYFILENNSVLKAALNIKRIQLTDFRTVSIGHFGEKKNNNSVKAHIVHPDNHWEFLI